ncbi:MAG TPA: PrsW family intramembrane metalloprotease [Labilithrix sp.]
MLLYICIALGALPALVVMAYFDRLDAKRPEPRSTLRKVAFAGGVAVLPCILIEVVLDKVGPHGGYGAAMFKGFVVAAMVEELAKVLCMRWFVWNRPEFDERMDGITYATRAGLGFALVENVGYLMQQKGLAQLAVVFMMRALLAVPGHAIYAGIMGYCASRKRFDGKGIGLAGGYLIAVLLHGGYDSAVFVALEAHHRHQDLLTVCLLPIPLFIVIIGGVVLRGMVLLATKADDEAAARGQLAYAPTVAFPGPPPPQYPPQSPPRY